MTDTREKLSMTSVGLHWVIGITMIAMVFFGLFVADMPKGDARNSLLGIHKSIGILVLLLAAWRFSRRMRLGMLQSVGEFAPWEKLLHKGVMLFLLFATLAIPLSGILMTIGAARPIALFGVTVIPQLLAEKNQLLGGIGHTTHEVLGWALLAAVVLHVSGALKHHFIDGDGTLKRMAGARVDPVTRA